MAKKEKELPVDEIISFYRQGYNDVEIVKYLREEGYSIKEINDSINQAKIKFDLSREGESEENYEGYKVPVPASEEIESAEAEGETEMQPQISSQELGQQYDYDYLQSSQSTEELIEEIVNEKWKEFKERIGNLNKFKKDIDLKLTNLNERIKRLELTMDRTQAALFGKLQEYNQNIKMLGSEINALENAFSKILQPLSLNVKEMSRKKITIPKTLTSEKKASASQIIEALKAIKSKNSKKEK